MRMLSLLIFFAATPALAFDISEYRRLVVESPTTEQTYLPPEVTDFLLGLHPGDLYVEKYENGVRVMIYLGPQMKDGERIFVSDTKEILSNEAYAERKAEFGEEIAKSGNIPGTSPGGTRWSEKAGKWAEGAAGAAVTGALVKGLEVGVLITPNDQRELAELNRKFEEALAAAQAAEAGLISDIFRYDQMVVSAMKNSEAEWAKLKASKMPDFHLPESPEGGRLYAVREQMDAFQPSTELEGNLKDASLTAASLAESELAQNNTFSAGHALDLAEFFSDLALGLNPVTALAKDGIEFFSGRHALTGRDLSAFERGLAGFSFAAGLATAGFASSFIDGVGLAGKLGARFGKKFSTAGSMLGEISGFTRELGLQTTAGLKDFVAYSRRTLGSEIGAVGNLKAVKEKLHLGDWAKKFNLHRIHSAEALNAADIAKNPSWKPAYKPGTYAYDLITKEKETFLRLHGPSNQQGRWLVRPAAVDKTLSAEQLAAKYSLPGKPTLVTEVVVEKSALLRRSRVNSAFGGGDGAIQYEVRDDLKTGLVKFGEAKSLSSPR